MRLIKFFIKRGFPGGLARSVAKNFKQLSNEFPIEWESEKNSIFELIIYNRYQFGFKSDNENKKYLLSKVDKMHGFLDLCSFILSVESPSFVQNTREGRTLILTAVREELLKKGIPSNLV
jgi:hypothetical protein